MVKSMQKQNSNSNGEEAGDIKIMEAMMKEFKVSVLKKVEKLRKDMIEGFIKNDCEKLEAKIV